MHALVLVGLGMTELGSDHGCAVVTLARATSERLDAIDDTVLDPMLPAGRESAEFSLAFSTLHRKLYD